MGGFYSEPNIPSRWTIPLKSVFLFSQLLQKIQLNNRNFLQHDKNFGTKPTLTLPIIFSILHKYLVNRVFGGFDDITAHGYWGGIWEEYTSLEASLS